MRARPVANLLHQFQITWRSKNAGPIGLALELEIELELGFDVDLELEVDVEIEVEPELALEPNVKKMLQLWWCFLSGSAPVAAGQEVRRPRGPAGEEVWESFLNKPYTDGNVCMGYM